MDNRLNRDTENEVRQLLTTNDCWQFRQDHFAVLHWSANGSRRATVTFTLTELDQLHPQLVSSLRAQLTWWTMQGNGFSLPGHLVKSTLDLLRGNILQVTDLAGVTFTCNNLIAIEQASTHLDVAGDMFDYREINGFTFATNTYVSVVKTNNEAFEKTYPNWKTRLALCTELGIPKEELIAHVFNKVVAARSTDIALPEMN